MNNFNIDKLTCRFYEKELEQEFLEYRWSKIWNNLKILLLKLPQRPLSDATTIKSLFLTSLCSNKTFEIESERLESISLSLLEYGRSSVTLSCALFNLAAATIFIAFVSC